MEEAEGGSDDAQGSKGLRDSAARESWHRDCLRHRMA
jgi:hypothetical protein